MKQAFVNILNLALYQGLPRVHQHLSRLPGFVAAVRRLVLAKGSASSSSALATTSPGCRSPSGASGENGANASSRSANSLRIARAVLQGKAIIAVCLLSGLSPQWFIEFAETHSSSSRNGGLVSIVDHLAKEPSKPSYLSNCLQCLAMTMPGVVEIVMQQCTFCLSRGAARKNIPSDVAKELKVVVSQYPIVSYSLSSFLLGPGLRRLPIWDYLETHLRLVPTTHFPEKELFQEILMSVLESASRRTEMLSSMGVGAVESILRCLLDTFRLGAKGGDAHFLAFKVMSDIVMFQMRQPARYKASEDIKDGDDETTAALNSFIIQELLPVYPRVFDDHQPLPQVLIPV